MARYIIAAALLTGSAFVAAAGKPLSISLTPSAQTVTEGQSASLCLNKSGGNGRQTAAKVTTSDGWSGSVVPGSCFTIPTKDDALVNGARDIIVTATASTGVTAIAVIHELDNDVAPPPPTNGPSGEATIADNFNTASGIEQTWYGPSGRGGIAPASADPVGAFRLFCGAGQLLKDDPLVYPGQPGASHLHQFFGNLGANASSNYNSLRTSGDSTCDIGSVPNNRSAYWMPAMMDGAGGVVKPNWLKVYYKRNPKSDPMCKSPDQGGIGICTDLPNGIRYVFGYNMKTMSGGPNDLNSQDSGAITFQCWSNNEGAPAVAGYFHNLRDIVAAGCPAGALLMIVAAAPICWDGVNLDSADHRSHMAMANGPMYPGQFFRACPSTHPYLIDSLEVQAAFRTDANFVAGKWHLSSDEMVPGTVPGSTWHMDYWEAWSPTVKKTWHDNCINLKLSGSGGDMCNGTQIIGANGPPWPQDFPDHVVVPVQ